MSFKTYKPTFKITINKKYLKPKRYGNYSCSCNIANKDGGHTKEAHLQGVSPRRTSVHTKRGGSVTTHLEACTSHVYGSHKCVADRVAMNYIKIAISLSMRVCVLGCKKNPQERIHGVNHHSHDLIGRTSHDLLAWYKYGTYLKVHV